MITLAAVFQLSSIVQLVSYTALGLFTLDLFTLGVVACIPMLLALMAGIAVLSPARRAAVIEALRVLIRAIGADAVEPRMLFEDEPAAARPMGAARRAGALPSRRS